MILARILNLVSIIQHNLVHMSQVSKHLNKVGKAHYGSGKQFIMVSPPVKVCFRV